MSIISHRKRRRDVLVELIHRIQSLLPVEEAARTCVLSKSWSHAWSTIPVLRFPYQQINYNNLIDATLQRYDRDNLPVETFDFNYKIVNELSAYLAKKWIRYLLPCCLKQLYLCIWVDIDSFTLPNQIFSSKYLNTIHVTNRTSTMDNSLWICNNPPMINCLSLRVLHLECLHITENLLDNLFTTCTLLEKINLDSCEGFNTVKVKNLLRLQELKIVSLQEKDDDILEIDNVPSLAVFQYTSLLTTENKPIPFNIKSLGSNVTQLSISGVILDNAFFNIIKLQFPLLQSLNLGIGHGGMETFVITSVSLKSLDLRLLISRSFDMQVYAPNLLYCLFHGGAPRNIDLHSLSFPNTPPDQLQLKIENVNNI